MIDLFAVTLPIVKLLNDNFGGWGRGLLRVRGKGEFGLGGFVQPSSSALVVSSDTANRIAIAIPGHVHCSNR